MTADETASDWTAVEAARLRWRVQRMEAIDAALSLAAPGSQPAGLWRRHPAARFAVLHHALYGVERSCAARDSAQAHWALAAWSRPEDPCPALVIAASHDLVLVDSAQCSRHLDERYESPALAITGSTLAHPQDASRLEDAASLVVASGLGQFFPAIPGAVVRLQRRSVTEQATSYTLSGLMGTVFVDWPDDLVRLAEALLHEAGHCWLNEALHALAEDLPPEPRWYSPWKRAPRPAFGLIHAGLAFSLLARFFDVHASSSRLRQHEREYCRARSRLESANLATARASLEEALRCLRSDALVRILRGHYNAALLVAGP